MNKHNSPVGYASDALDICREAIVKIEEMEKEQDGDEERLACLFKDKQRFQVAIDKMLEVLRD